MFKKVAVVSIILSAMVTTQVFAGEKVEHKEVYYDKPQIESGRLIVLQKPFDVIADEVIAGSWGRGTELRAKLAAGGYNYDTIQKEINKKMAGTIHTYRLDPVKGAIEGPSGKETYYNLPMQGVINIMRARGFSEEDYPYWVRDDGVKMLGPYVMVAADLSIRPRGSLIESSLGMALVCDTGEFVKTNPTQLDIAVNW